MEPGNAAVVDSAEWIGAPIHDESALDVRPRRPTEDPFYLPPAGFEHAAPGTVLRSRDVRLGFLGLIPQRITAMQLLYRTVDMHGAPEAAVTTVLIPGERSPHIPTPVVSYQCAIDAITDRCFPSYALRQGSRSLGSVAHIDFLMIAAALAEGWVISVPDHEGIRGRWGAPGEPGYHALDGLRAALATPRLQLAPDAPIGLWGYSGGGLATAWTVELCADYAPELNIVGAVLGSPVGDLGHTFRRLNGTMYSGLPAIVVAALAHIYPDLSRIVEEHATVEGKALLKRIESMTTVEAVIRLFRKDVGDLIDCPLELLLDSPELQRIFDDIKLGHTAPTPPVLIVQAVHDRIVSVEAIDELTDIYTLGGAHVTYHRDMFSEHLLLHPMSAPMTLRWLIDRFEGRPLGEHMVRTKWPTLLNPLTYAGMWRLGTVTARVITGKVLHRRPL
jgi:triacylglycerol lipase